MKKEFIGRNIEIQQLDNIMASGKAEFVAIYGRRRVGKTFLIQEYFHNDFAFSATGIIDGSRDEQFFSFTTSLIHAGYVGRQPKTWLEAFEMLKTIMEKKKVKNGRRVIYIDELPCFDTLRSGFVRALGYFWNTWASLHNDVILIVCGSATAWMVDNIIDNHGGLHDRITHSIYLQQFSLAETEAYLQSLGIHWPRHTIVETYMILGGIPYYISLFNKKESLAQNIDRIYFRKNSELALEYRRLYGSLFRQPELYLSIVEALGKSKQGLTRNEIAQALKIQSSGTLTKHLDNLVSCDIVRRYVTKVNGKPKTNDAYYQLVDLFTLFHLTFAKKLTTDDYWEQRVNTPTLNTWQGLAFEHVCLAHIKQIRHALGLDRIAVEYYSWRNDKPKAQVDLIIERADRLVNLCEIKYTHAEYTISADDDKDMRSHVASFASRTKNKCGILPTWITPYGLADNAYSADIQYEVTMDDLFL